MNLSVLILTLNEAQNLKGCLESVAWCDDVVVLDSYSTDHTEDVTRQFRARFIQREFDDFAGQRNFAIDRIPFKHEWVFHLDADEQFSPELADECRKAIADDGHSGFLVPSKMILRGRWLKHAANYPVYQMRLMKLGEVRSFQHGHGQRELSTARGLGKLSTPYLHYSFSKGLHEWFERHNRYSRMEAEACLKELEGGSLDWQGLFSRDAILKRRALKNLSFRLPFRPWLKFAYMYFLRMGFLEGNPGFTYCVLQAIYEYMICLKLKELRAYVKTPVVTRASEKWEGKPAGAVRPRAHGRGTERPEAWPGYPVEDVLRRQRGRRARRRA